MTDRENSIRVDTAHAIGHLVDTLLDPVYGYDDDLRPHLSQIIRLGGLFLCKGYVSVEDITNCSIGSQDTKRIYDFFMMYGAIVDAIQRHG